MGPDVEKKPPQSSWAVREVDKRMFTKNEATLSWTSYAAIWTPHEVQQVEGMQTKRLHFCSRVIPEDTTVTTTSVSRAN